MLHPRRDPRHVQKHRQPETLQEASGYLDRLTQGRYHRVWTPFGEHALRVDDAEGRSLPVEVLSRGRGAASQFGIGPGEFLRPAGIALALGPRRRIGELRRRAAKAAAAVLRDFAAAGHQLLVFTCHEHILKLFKSLRVPVSRLPSNETPGGVVISVGVLDEEKAKREKSRVLRVASPR